MLQIRLLGQFDIRLDGKRVTISTRAGQSLLAYLALTAGNAHRREKIAGTFWPDTSEESARKNLRQELWRIRKALSAQRANTEEYFIANDLTVALNRNSEYWLDVTQLERPDLDLESLTTNLALYQGELLPGFYDEWIVIERERIQSIFDNKMGQLLEQLTTSERWIAVQEQSERWLALGNTIEPAYRGLMLSYGARGDMAKVSTIYQRCITDLDEKFGLEPSPETRALYDGLLKGSHVVSRTAQPSGTVTFLFTDIEGSTSLLDKLRDQYAAVLAEHHKIMRASIQKWNGREVDTQGDAFFITFARALDAVQCAAEAQRELALHTWPHKRPIHVRMGLHTGEPLLASIGYVGMDVHRAARIGDAGHGGQILLSQTTRELVIQDLPDGLTIRNLGEYRLKDLRFPTSIHQLVVEGLKSEFPPLRTKFSGTESPTPGDPPFKGLQYFNESDSDLFFGRELLTAKLINRLHETQFLSVVIGASGSGKSSLVRAGLIPALRSEKELIDGTKPLEGSSEWRVHIITPTAHPIEALAVELTRDSESLTAAATLMDDLMQDPRSLALHFARINPKQHVLLVLDQFEELFTLCRDEFEREAFIDNLLTTISHNETPDNEGKSNANITLILTLRADFYAHLAQYPELRDAVAKQQEYIGPMTMEELRRAIEEPAKQKNWDYEPGLVDLILRDVGDEPGALPLLSHALLETWKRRAGHTLTLKGYADAGGVRGAIAHTAESVYQELSPEEQVITRDIFLRLTELGEGTEDTRRRVSFDELNSNMENADEVRNVLNILADARLVTLGEDTVEVAHEALIREWPTLREWLNQDREGLQLHRHLTEAAHEWELLERDAGSVYHGARLAQANEWASLNPNVLNAQEKLFLDESNKQAKREETAREEQRMREATLKQRVQRVLQVLVGVLLIAAIVSGGLAFWANSQREEALRQASIGFAAQAKIELDGAAPERSVLLALEAIENYPYTWQAEQALGQIVQEFRLRHIVIGHTDTVLDMAWSPDGSKFATTGKDGTLRIWDAQNNSELLTISAHPAFDAGFFLGVRELAWSPDGSQIVTAGLDKTAKVWDVATGKDIAIFSGHADEVWSVAWSANGRWIASASKDGTVKVWDAKTGKDKFTLSNHSGSVRSVAWSPNGTQIATASDDGTTRLWDAETGEEQMIFSGHTNWVWSVAWSPDGTRLATASEDGTVRIWNVMTGKELSDLRLANPVWQATWSPNGLQLATTGATGIGQVWNVASGKEAYAMQGHTDEVFDIAWSPDGKLLATTGGAGYSVQIWDASPATRTLTGTQNGIGWVSWSPDGTRIATSDTYGTTALIWDSKTGEILQTLDGHTVLVQDVFWSPDSSQLVTTGFDNLAKVWDANTGKELLTFSGHVGEPVGKFMGIDALFGGGWSPDGSRIMTVGGNGTVRVWDAHTGEEDFVFQPTYEAAPSSGWSPDGTRIATCSIPQVLQLWDASTGASIFGGYVNNTADLSFGDSVDFCSSSLWSPDGKRILTASWGGKGATIWDSETGEKLLVFTEHNAGLSLGASWSPNGRRIATGDFSGGVKIWDPDTGAVLLSFSVPISEYLTNVAWSPDGTSLVGSGLLPSIEIYRVWQTTEDLVKYAKECCIVRELTQDERQQFGLPIQENEK